MKCPYCEYEDGWDNEIMETVKGNHGIFFNLNHNTRMRRKHLDYYSSRDLIGCPKCDKVFMH